MNIGRILIGTSLVGLLILYGVVTYHQNTYWRDKITFWEHAVSISPKSGAAHGALAIAYRDKGYIDKARVEGQRSLALDPGLWYAYMLLGDIYGSEEKWDQAIMMYKIGMKGVSRYGRGQYNLGVAYSKKGNLEQAESYFKKSIAIRDDMHYPHYELALLYRKQDRFEDAEREYLKVLSMQPDHVMARYGLAKTLEWMGRREEAIRLYQDVMRLSGQEDTELGELREKARERMNRMQSSQE